MIHGSVASRYARALYEEAKAQFVDEIIYDHLGMLYQSMLAAPDLQSTLINPRVSKDKKFQLLVMASGVNSGAWAKADTAAHSESYTHTLYTRFLQLVLDHHREANLRLMIFVYRDMYRRARNIDRVVFETAAEVDDSVVEHLVSTVKEHTHRDVECECVVNPDLIGGFRLRVGDNRYDCSYRGRLDKIKKQLMEAQ